MGGLRLLYWKYLSFRQETENSFSFGVSCGVHQTPRDGQLERCEPATQRLAAWQRQTVHYTWYGAYLGRSLLKVEVPKWAFIRFIAAATTFKY